MEKLKILLAQNDSYYPALGGANKSNRTMLEDLAKLGGICRVVATTPRRSKQEESLEELHPVYIKEDVAAFELNGVNVHAVRTNAAMDFKVLREHFIEQIEEFEPDIVFVSTEDIGQILLEAAISRVPEKVVYLARTTLYLPFGPDCYLEIPTKKDLLTRAGGIICVGEYIKDYIEKYGKAKSVVLPISTFGEGPFPKYCNKTEGYITMVNPCDYKGISIFLELAKAFPNEKFAAIPTWGTTSKNIEDLKALDNVTIFPPFENMNDIFSQTKVMLVPSLWAEAKSRTIVEAMLRGVPVMASDVGGNREAKLGIDFTLPVNPITGYHEICDEKSLPVTNVPKQDMEPWIDALNKLLTDEKFYEEISEKSYEVANQYVIERGGSERVYEYLVEVKDNQENKRKEILVAESKKSTLDKLTDKQKVLLALRLKQEQRKG